MKKYRYLLLIVIAGSALAFMLFIINQTVEVKNDLKSPMSTVLLDNDGNEIVESKNTWVQSENVPELISTYIQNETDDLGRLLYPTQTIKRLLTNIIMTSYSEDEMYEVYINKVYLDNGIVGFGNAANYYFNKSLKDTSALEQIYLLYKSKNLESRNIQVDLDNLITSLVTKDYIEKEEMITYQSSIPELLKGLHHKTTFAQSYVDLAIDELKNILDVEENEIFQEGYMITTNLNRNLQLRLYDSFMDQKTFPENEKTIVEGGMVVLESKTGQVAGLMGGREYQMSTYNRSTDTTRQPASTFKPLIVYGPAIEQGWKHDDSLKDKPLSFNGYEPKNHDGTFHGEVTLHESLVMSYNVPTAWLLYKIGLESGLEYINKFDLFKIDPTDEYKLALGFTKVGTSPLAIAQAYTSFANDGVMVDAQTIQRIETRSGKVNYKPKAKKTKIFEKSTAETMTSLLQDVVNEGTAENAHIPGQQIAGKTGTTSFDGWFVGFNEKYVGAVWMGPDEVVPENRMWFGTSPSGLFKNIFEELGE
ncbi:transglycosylase domain-containing protein [Ferdinandcohnia sp. Marseille-Q9671]